MVPPKSFDLYRYFIDLDHYRNMNFNESIIDIFSRPNFIWYIIMRIIALLFTDNRCIFLLTIPVTIGIFAYILYKISYNFKLSNRQIVLSILCFFSIISTVHLMSGIRNALAFSLFSLGFYLNNLESKKTGYWFYILSFFIHPMIIIPLFFTFLGKYISKIKYIEFGLLIWKPAAWIILLLIELIPISLFQLYATKLKIELTYVFGIDIRIFLFELLQMIIITILMLIIHKVKKENINSIEAKNTTIFYYLSFFIIGSITMNNIF
jgi:hypothetical protein